jgi:hypothetical protein
LTLSEVSFAWTSAGVFFTWHSLESSSLDPLWSLLYSTLYYSLRCLTLSEISFAWASAGVFFTWPSLESPLLDHLLKYSVWVSQSVSQSVRSVSVRLICFGALGVLNARPLLSNINLTGRYMINSRQGQEKEFLFATASRPVLGLTKPPNQWV